MSYVIFDPKVNCPLHELNRQAAQIAYDFFIASIPERISILGEEIGFRLRFNESEPEKVFDFLDARITDRFELLKQPDGYLFSISNDIGMYLSEYIIRNSETVRWHFFTEGPNDKSYHRPVLIGFNVKNKLYNVDFDYALCAYCFSALEERAISERVRRYFKSAIHDA